MISYLQTAIRDHHNILTMGVKGEGGRDIRELESDMAHQHGTITLQL